MPLTTPTASAWRSALRRTKALLLAPLLLVACSGPTPPGGPRGPQSPEAPRSPGGTAPGAAAPAATPGAEALREAALGQPPAPSAATTPRAYRQDAARHLYAHNFERIWKGKLQPNLYAIGVLEVDIDRQGRVTATRWMRAPQHAPEVMAEILRTVRAAAPYPVPTRLGRVTYTDVWLWDKSGQFQLDTLTEGQL